MTVSKIVTHQQKNNQRSYTTGLDFSHCLQEGCFPSMSLIKDLFSWLYISRYSTELEDHPDLSPLDFDDLKNELAIELDARRLARAGQPETDATSFSAPEMRIIQRLEAVRANYRRWVIERIEDVQKSLNTFDITKLVNRARDYAEEFER